MSSLNPLPLNINQAASVAQTSRKTQKALNNQIKKKSLLTAQFHVEGSSGSIGSPMFMTSVLSG